MPKAIFYCFLKKYPFSIIGYNNNIFLIKVPVQVPLQVPNKTPL